MFKWLAKRVNVVVLLSVLLLLSSCVHQKHELESLSTDTGSTLRCLGYCEVTIKDTKVDVALRKADEAVIDELKRGSNVATENNEEDNNE